MSTQMNTPRWLAALTVAAAMALTPLAPASAATITSVSPVLGSAVTAPANTVKTTKTTDKLNLRKGPGAQYASLTILKKGTVLNPSGKTSGKWRQVKVGKYTGWVSADYLKTTVGVAKAPAVKPIVGPNRWIDGTQPIYTKPSSASKRLMAQTGGTGVTLLKSSGKWSYVQAPTGRGWIESSSLARTKAKASGHSTTHRWTTSTANVRKGTGTSFASLGTVPANQKVAYLKTANGWSQVKTTRGTGWIKNTLLTNIEYRAPRPLQPMTKSMIKDVEKRYGKGLIGVGGSRSGSTGHGGGLAADFMIKNYSSAAGIKAGDEMAKYLIANHKKLGIGFIIWRDKLWLSYDGQWGAYSKGGWGKHLEMSRGWNVTTRHMDHIHAEIASSRALK